ncbi:MAG: phosphate signaling complex protein PhoU [Lachnospiraceae bacterium]
MRERYMKQLKQLNDLLTQMGQKVEHAIELAINALISQDVEKAKETIAYDEEIDEKEKEIEQLCLKLLLCQQPVAKDLRFISAALKMITDLERIGDHASDIAELVIFLAEKPYINKLDYMKQMAAETTDMVIRSINAYVDNNVEDAKQVILHDDVVDRLFVTVKNEMIQLIHEDVNNGEQATDLLMVAKYFERIGDHATNIAEWVIFSVTGEKGKG